MPHDADGEQLALDLMPRRVLDSRSNARRPSGPPLRRRWCTWGGNMPSGTPAGWYPNPDGSATSRYWDGGAWTEQMMPNVTPPPPPPAGAPTSPTVPLLPPTPTVPLPPAPVPAAAGSAKRKWVIGGAIAAGALVFGAIGSAIGAGRGGNDAQPAAAPTATVTAEAPSPSEEPVDEEPEETPEPTPTDEPEEPAADPVAFTAQANSHLDDMRKDLDDLRVTVEEEGFWRLLSNYAELAFNVGQLEALDVPANVAKKWDSQLAKLDKRLDELSEAIATEDGPTILTAVSELEDQVESARKLADAAN